MEGGRQITTAVKYQRRRSFQCSRPSGLACFNTMRSLSAASEKDVIGAAAACSRSADRRGSQRSKSERDQQSAVGVFPRSAGGRTLGVASVATIWLELDTWFNLD